MLIPLEPLWNNNSVKVSRTEPNAQPAAAVPCEFYEKICRQLDNPDERAYWIALIGEKLHTMAMAIRTSLIINSAQLASRLVSDHLATLAMIDVDRETMLAYYPPDLSYSMLPPKYTE